LDFKAESGKIAPNCPEVGDNTKKGHLLAPRFPHSRFSPSDRPTCNDCDNKAALTPGQQRKQAARPKIAGRGC